MGRILIVEDDLELMNELKIFLENSGYNVEVLNNFNNTVNDIIDNKSDLILLDVNIPNLNGEIVCKEVRKKIKIPIIIVTSKNTELDELISFNYGADDFIAKPYNTQILLARIERLLKNNNDVLNYKDFTLNLSKSIIIRKDEPTQLSKNEMKILYYLMINQGIIVSRDDLMDYLWNSNEFIDDNTLTVNINRLRNKLSNLGYKDAIKTKRGQGYILL